MNIIAIYYAIAERLAETNSSWAIRKRQITRQAKKKKNPIQLITLLFYFSFVHFLHRAEPHSFQFEFTRASAETSNTINRIIEN